MPAEFTRTHAYLLHVAVNVSFLSIWRLVSFVLFLQKGEYFVDRLDCENFVIKKKSDKQQEKFVVLHFLGGLGVRYEDKFYRVSV